MDPQSEPESLFLGWCVLFLTPTQASLAKTNHKTSSKQRCLQNALFLAKKKCGKKLGWLPKTNRVLEQSRSFSLAICEAKKKTPPKNIFWLFQEGVFFVCLLLVAGLAGFCWACWVLPVLSEPFHTNLYGMNGFCRTCWVLQYLLGFAGFAVFFFFLL